MYLEKVQKCYCFHITDLKFNRHCSKELQYNFCNLRLYIDSYYIHSYMIHNIIHVIFIDTSAIEVRIGESILTEKTKKWNFNCEIVRVKQRIPVSFCLKRLWNASQKCCSVALCPGRSSSLYSGVAGGTSLLNPHLHVFPVSNREFIFLIFNLHDHGWMLTWLDFQCWSHSWGADRTLCQVHYHIQ